MPYGGTIPSQDARIERCVKRQLAKGVSKESAIRICKSSIMQSDKKGGSSWAQPHKRQTASSRSH